MEPITIGVTDCGRYENYAGWIKNSSGVEVIRLSYHLDNFAEIKKCDGIVITGGQDVHPRFFNKIEYMDFYKGSIPDIDEQRDEFELKVLAYSQQKKLPLLGICRGLQIANVYFGGTLVLDIPSMGKRNHSKLRESEDRYHEVAVTRGSALETITGQQRGEVNSAHHQSALVVADNLVASAFSEDDVIEALERKDFIAHPYLMLVQWHPERMINQESPFTLNIKNSFLDAVRKSQPALENNI